MTEREQHQLLYLWNDTETHLPTLTIPRLIEAQAEQTPDTIAAAWADIQLTYATLNQQANQLARALIEAGVCLEDIVVLLADRNNDFLIAFLAILKAGGAVLPLSPTAPPERINRTLSHCGASTILVTSQFESLIAGKDNDQIRHILNLETLLAETHDSSNLSVEVSGGNLAYVMYTSGSTGIPKGVMVEHLGMLNHILAKINDVQLTAEDILAQNGPQSFDIVVWQLLAPLVVGGRVQFLDDAVAHNPLELLNALENNRISVLQLVPAILQAMIQEVEALDVTERPPLTGLKWIVPTGDALTTNLCRAWLTLYPDIPLLNTYGTTECSDDQCHYPVIEIPAPDYAPPIMSIGRPIGNMRAYVLDSTLSPVPVGVTGQLYIAGIGVGRGYLHNPIRTAESFIPDPIAGDGTRLYNTGDLARYLPDGSLEFLGRADHQVKIRGFRIELGEIEAVLDQHETVQASVVVAHEDERGHKYLVAYVAGDVWPAAEEQEATIANLRQFLQTQLPEAMIPADIILLPTLPLTPHGKIDRRALPTPSLVTKRVYTPPKTPAEMKLADIWADVLTVESIGIHDNFFDLGGHSLLATQVISRIQRAFQIELPLRSLFEHPTIAALAKAVVQANPVDLPAIVPVPRQKAMPLSFMQRSLWFLEQLEGPSPTYNMPTAFRLTGDLDLSALVWCLNTIIARHEVLRTTFHSEAGTGWQIIQDEVELHLPLVDLQHLSPEMQDAMVERLADAEAIRPFDLARDLMIRATLLQLAPQAFVLLVTKHHIASDDWSITLLVQEVVQLYQARIEGREMPLFDLPIQYADYAAWQQTLLQGEPLANLLAYWQEQLAAPPPVLDLPVARARPPKMTYDGAHTYFDLPEAINKQLGLLGRQTGATHFMILLTIFKILLYRYSGQADLVIGSPTANRTRLETEALIGFFVNTLALRTDLSGNPTFLALLDQIKQVTQQAFDHQDLPFELLVETLQPERSLNHSPLFQVMFVWQNAPHTQLELPGLTLTPLTPDFPAARYDLTLVMQEYEGQLIGRWVYNTTLFEPEVIDRMNDHFQTLLTDLLANPAQSIDEPPLLTHAERDQLLVEWNSTQQPKAPLSSAIHHLFETQVKHTPDSIAVVFENQHLTYEALNQRANQLAHYLKAKGIGPESFVGVCVERSVEMMVAVLGILKAGGAYIPLDPDYPAERLAFMLADSQAALLITQSHLLNQISTETIEHLCLDTDWSLIAPYSNKNPETTISPHHLAYIIYTSGSTGQPRGVMMSHQAVCNHLWCRVQTFKLTADDRILQKMPFSFDASVWEIFMPLICGAQVVMAKPGGHRDGTYLIEAVKSLRITATSLIPTQLRMVIEAGGLADCANLHHLSCGGEFLPLAVVEAVKAQSPTDVYNVYGPTEACVSVIWWHYQPGAEIVPIGRPIVNTDVYILDHTLEPVPIGVPGELYIGGIPLARGYLNRPRLTAELFIPHPFASDGGQRLYKTGDLARYLPDGTIEFLGRIDDQVKIRGFRIELGEIEAVLNQHPKIKDGVVITYGNSPEDQRLAAYLSRHQAQSQIVAVDDRRLLLEIEAHLKQKLPDYMIPETFTVLDKFPLNPAGKIDRRALPKPELISTGETVLPRNPVELQLGQIWQEVLDLTNISIRANFFDIGGHSLMAIRLMALIQEQFDQKLALATLFEYPTIETFAAFLQQQTTTEMGSPIVPIQRRGTKPPLFFVPGPAGNPIYLYPLARHLGSDQPFYGLQSPGLDGSTEPLATIEAVAAHFVTAIQQIQPEGPYYLGGHSAGGKVALEMAQQLLHQGHQVAMLAIFDSILSAERDDVLTRTDVDWLLKFAAQIEGIIGEPVDLSEQNLVSLSYQEQLYKLKTQMETFNLLPTESDIKLVEGQIAVYKANRLAASIYVPGNVESLPITLFCPSDQPERDHEAKVADWSTIGPVDLHLVAGGHITMVTAPSYVVIYSTVH
ncbi:MAG: amino acid adenylation domain-containing protein [Chloroflexota bacterium]